MKKTAGMSRLVNTGHERFGESTHPLQIEMIETDAALALQEAIRLSRLAANTIDYDYALAETAPFHYDDQTVAVPTRLKVWADEAVIGMGIALYTQVVEDSLPQGKPEFYALANPGPIADITYYEVYAGMTPAWTLNPYDRLEQANYLNKMSQLALQAQEEQFFGTL